VPVVTTRFRLRVELPDRPGALAHLAGVIAGEGGSVLSVDIHDLDRDRAVDDLVVALPDTSPERLAARLSETGAGEVQWWRLETGTADSVVRALGWVRHVLEAGVGYSDLEVSRALTEICAADTAWVATRIEADEVPAATEALATGAPTVTFHDPLPPAVGGDGTRSAWLLVAADDANDPSTVAFVARHRPHRFTTTEVARARALLALHHELRPTALRPPGL
jgi:ACT domain